MPNKVCAADLRHYSDDVLDALEPLLPEWKPAIDEVRAERIAWRRVWNSARLLAAELRKRQEIRWQAGYSLNEEARGVDEAEAMAWQEIRERICYLRHRSLWTIRRRHNQRSHTPVQPRMGVEP